MRENEREKQGCLDGKKIGKREGKWDSETDTTETRKRKGGAIGKNNCRRKRVSE